MDNAKQACRNAVRHVSTSLLFAYAVKCFTFYRVSKILTAIPTSCVVVGYDVDTTGFLICKS